MLRSFFIAILFLVLSSRVHSQPVIEWERPLGGSKVDCSYSVLQTSDGGYIAVGHSGSIDGDGTTNHGDLDFWVTKLDSKGVLVWQHSYGGSSREEAYSIAQTSDGGFVLAGYTQSNDGDVTGNHGAQDCWIVKIDLLGNLMWQKTLGGSKGEEIYGTVSQTLDGGYILVAQSRSSDGDVTFNHGYDDAWVVKLDKTGNIEWQRSYGGSQADEPYCIKPTTDGGYIFVGYTESSDGDVTFNHGYRDCWVVKIDNVGNIEWQKTYGGSGIDEGYSIEQTADGNYIVAGATTSSNDDLTFNQGSYDFWVMKLDVSGTILWSKTYGGSYPDIAYCIHQTKDGGYIVSGDTRSNDGDVSGNHGDYDGWVLKLSSSGDIEWQKAFGGSYLDEAYDIKETSDGGYIFTGSDLSVDGDVVGHHGNGGVSDFWVVKLACMPISVTTYLKNMQYNPRAGDTIEIPIYMNNSYGQPPYTFSASIYDSLDFSLNTNFVTPIAFIPSFPNLSVSSLIISQGRTNLVLQGSKGIVISGEKIIGKLHCIIYLSDSLESSVVLKGGSFSTSQNSPCLSLSVQSDSIIITLNKQCGDSILNLSLRNETFKPFRIITVSPNPVKSALLNFNYSSRVDGSLSISIFDVTGNEVKQIISGKQIKAGGDNISADLTGIPSGTYWYKFDLNGIIETGSIIVMK